MMSDLSKQTWVLTGAGGVIAKYLRARMAPLVGSLRLLDIKQIENLHEREEAFIVDILDLKALNKAVSGAHGILHLAGLADEADFHDLLNINILGTYNVLEVARQCGVSRFIYASSNRATGFYSTADIISTSMAPRPDGFYGVSKETGEALSRVYADKFGLEVAALRIGSFEDAPMDERQLSTWLSPADCFRAFLAAMTVPKLTYAAFYAVSRNKRGWWDLRDGKAVGFEPEDDAEDYAEGLGVGGVKESAKSGPQGGVYATPGYTLDRQRSLSL